MEFSSIEQNIATQARRMQKDLPTSLKNAPELELGLSLYLNAFFDLDSERPNNGFGPSRISAYAVRRYANEFEFDEVQTEMLSEYIGVLDKAYIKWASEKNGKSS